MPIQNLFLAKYVHTKLSERKNGYSITVIHFVRLRNKVNYGYKCITLNVSESFCPFRGILNYPLLVLKLS